MCVLKRKARRATLIRVYHRLGKRRRALRTDVVLSLFILETDYQPNVCPPRRRSTEYSENTPFLQPEMAHFNESGPADTRQRNPREAQRLGSQLDSPIVRCRPPAGGTGTARSQPSLTKQPEAGMPEAHRSPFAGSDRPCHRRRVETAPGRAGRRCWIGG